MFLSPFLSLLCVYAVLLLWTATEAEGSKCVRGCYFTNWAHERKGRAKFNLTADYRTGLCTHILYAFFGFETTGKKAYRTRELVTKDNNIVYRNKKPLFYKEIQEMKKQDPNLKVLLSFGGWSFGQLMSGTPFLPMAQSAKNSKIFINSAIKYAKKYGFDGIDIDWEYPEGHGQTQIMTKFLEYLTGFNAPLYSRKGESSYQILLNTAAAANLWIHYGLPKNKLIVGLAMYGRGWSIGGGQKPSASMLIADNPKPGRYTKEAGFLAYYEICEMISNKKQCGSKPGKSYYEKQSKVPYLICGNEWTGYDDKKSIGEKVKHIKKKGYGGAFVWAMDLDDFNGKCPNGKGEKYPLMSVIEKDLNGEC